MTLKRAAEILDPEHREHYDSIETVNEACKIGREAVLSKIKKKPTYEGDGYDENGALIYDTAYCPVCEHEFEYGVNDWESNFCPDCGQALDWSDTE
jgi:hypothetical protein